MIRSLRSRQKRLSVEPLEDRHLLATFTVDTPFDLVDPDDGLTSFREALAQADDESRHPGHDTIIFDAALRFATVHADIVGFGPTGEPLFDLPEAGPPVPIIKGQFEISSDVTIDASGVELVRIGHERGFSQSHRIFKIHERARVEMVNVVVQGGDAFFQANPETADGGGIWNAGVLTLRNVVVGGNVTTSPVGGGDVYVDDPSGGGLLPNVKFRGGGIFNAASGNVTLVNSHIGEIELDEDFLQRFGIDGDAFQLSEEREYDRLTTAVVVLDPSLTVNDPGLTRISGNVSWGDGGGIYNEGALTVTAGSVVARNRVTGDGAGIYNAGRLQVTDSVIRDHASLVAQSSPAYVVSLAGAGVYNAVGGDLRVEASAFLRNRALVGGGIYNAGTLEVADTNFLDNQAQFYDGVASGFVPQGGAIYDTGDWTRIRTSSFSGGSAEDGGGFYVTDHPDAALDTVTISGNIATRGGGLHLSPTAQVRIDNATITANRGFQSGGGVHVDGGGSLAISGTILADNFPARGGVGRDLAIDLAVANFSSDGNNLFGATEGNGLTSADVDASDRLNVDPRLGPLRDFGGNTLTHGLLADSPALDSFEAASQTQPIHAYDLSQSLSDLLGGPDLEVVADLAADGNGDGVVDAQDFDVMMTNMGAGPAEGLPGDYNRDRFVTPTDYLTWVAASRGTAPTALERVVGFTEGGYRFSANEGLRLSGFELSGDYSVEVVFAWDTVEPTPQRKILDFQDRAIDEGVYSWGDRVRFENESPLGRSRLEAQTFSKLLVTRDALTDSFVAYLDGIRQWGFDDLDGYARLDRPDSVLHFFLDDIVTAGAETGSGVVKSVAVFDRALSAADVRRRHALSTDQRGEPRQVGAARDRGAFESQPLGALRVDTLSGVADGFYGEGEVSLAEAVQWANAIPGADSIAFAPELVTLLRNLDADHRIPLDEPLVVTDDLTLWGAGADLVQISGQQRNRVFEVVAGVDLHLKDITIRDGVPSFGGSPGGSGILSRGNLTLERVVVAANQEANLGGGILQEGGRLTIVDSTLHDNRGHLGGGLYATGADVVVENSTISGNEATGRGGGIFLDEGVLQLRSSTVTANVAQGVGTLGDLGGGIDVFVGTFQASASVIAGNDVDDVIQGLRAQDLNITGESSAESGGYNLWGEVAGTIAFDVTDLRDTADPLLGVLRNLGGPTPVHSLLPGSPAIDVIPAGITTTRDQRGVPRPINALSDIGAFEFAAPVLTNPLVVDTLSGDSDGLFGLGELSLDEAILLVNDQGAANGIDEIQFAPNLFNLAQGTGVRVSASSSEAGRGAPLAVDGHPTTVWTAVAADTRSQGAQPYFEVDFPQDEIVAGLRIEGTTMVRGNVQLYDSGGALLRAVPFDHAAGTVHLSLRREDGSGVGAVRRIRIESLDEGDVAAVSIADMDIVGGARSIRLPERTLRLDQDVTLVGPGADRLRISAMERRRVFEVPATTTAHLSGVTIADGIGGSKGGGGLMNEGHLTLSNVWVTASQGGVKNSIGGTLAIEGSTISDNFGSTGGGVDNRGQLVVENSTISSNNAATGGGLYNDGSAILRFATIADNLAKSSGGIHNDVGGTLTIESSIVSNGIDGENLGIVRSEGFNLIRSNSGLGISPEQGDQFGTGQAPLATHLTGLVMVDGPMPIHALLPGSPAVDAGNVLEFPDVDQRGRSRPRGGGPDSGAYESEPLVVGEELVVDTWSDILNGDYSSGNLTLREAVLLANRPDNFDGPQTIRFLSSLIDNQASGGVGQATIQLSEGPLHFRDDIRVQPLANADAVDDPRRDAIVVDARGQGRVMEVDAGVTVSLANATVTGGAGNGNGGGILNRGDLALTDVEIRGNLANQGGGVFNAEHATLRVDRSVFEGNSADQGGGLKNLGAAQITRSSIVGNPGKQGGGVWSGGDLQITVSTVSGNGDASGLSASDQGGGVFVAAGTALIQDATIAANQAVSVGGLLNRGTLTLTGSIIADNVDQNGAADDAANQGILRDSRFNLLEDNATGFLPASQGNLFVSDAGLGPLEENGGRTPTHSLLLGSPAIDAGDPLTMRLFDQRGRPLTDLPATGDSVADIGAFERQQIVRSRWRYEALEKSQFGPGEATVFGFGFDDGRNSSSVNPEPHFLGFEFDTGPLTYGRIVEGAFGTRFGGELSADFAGRLGFDIGFLRQLGVDRRRV